MENLFEIVRLFVFAVFVAACSGASISSQKNNDWQPCRREYLRMMEEGRSLSDMLPRCTEHGLYKPLQKTYSNLECYHSNGEADNIYNYPGKGPCDKLKQCLKNHTLEGLEDEKLIRCDKFGLFEPLQKLEDEKLICTLPEGEFPAAYGVTDGARECIDLQPCIETTRGISLTGVTVRCDEKGRFKPLQLFNQRLECYFPNGVDFISEYDALGPCHKLKQCLRRKYHTTKDAKEHKLIHCDKHGYFKILQKQKNGKMICVDFYGNIRKSSGVTGKQDCLYSILIH